MNLWTHRARGGRNLLASHADSRNNNFNLMRLVAAAMVILAHSFFLTAQHGQGEPLQQLIGIDSGSLAVDIFFVISGLLVVKSYLKSQNALAYLGGRVLRIFPGLLVAVMFNAFVIGVVFTDLPLLSYLRQRELWDYVITNSLLISRLVQLNYALPGVFGDNPVSAAVNGSLWTLPYEVWLYLGLFFVGALGVFRSPRRTNALFLILIGINAAMSLGLLSIPYPLLGNFLRFSTFFGWGIVFYVNRQRIPIRGSIALVLVALAAAGWRLPVIQSFQFPLALAYSIFWLAYVPGGWIRKYNELGDYSYGLYIYAFPIQQSLLALLPDIRPLALLALASPIALGIAIFSWHLVEKPALQAKQKLQMSVMFRYWRRFVSNIVRGQSI